MQLKKHANNPVFILLILLSSVYQSSAQTSPTFVEGYYITNSFDTTKGFIEDKQWNKNPISVKFKNASGTIELTPVNSKEFQINGEDTYTSYKGKRMINPISTSASLSALSDSVSKYEDVEVFLRLIVRNELGTLWLLNDGKRENFFLQLPGKPIVELLFKSWREENTLADHKIYQQQLQATFGLQIANKNLSSNLERLAYNEFDLRNFLTRLSDTKKTRKKSKYPNEFSVLGGISINAYKVSGDPRNLATQVNYEPVISPVIGIGYTLYRQRNFGRYFANMELKSYSYKFSGNSSLYSSVIKSGVILNLNVYPGLNIINKKKLAWSVAAGPSLLYLSGNKEERRMIGSSFTSEGKNGPSLVFTVGAKTALKINNQLCAWSSYSFPASFTHYVYFTGWHSALQAGFGWTFPGK